ncbi:MerR family transcriptional regulator [Embleya sp. NBC_00896]|uniref:MerR family transcriptional regulator n=1 Tax=Embleya sp. NBC_00896 TaxID=2975961 RepID=UPI00386795FB
MTENGKDLSIGEVATRTGLSIDTLRFYEREGILANPVRRGPGGRRVYAEHDIAWLDMCIVLRASGMPIPAIRHYTELARAGAGTERERLGILREHQDRVRSQIDQLHRCLDLIGYKVGVYEDYLDEVEAGEEGGAGPGREATGCGSSGEVVEGRDEGDTGNAGTAGDTGGFETVGVAGGGGADTEG